MFLRISTAIIGLPLLFLLLYLGGDWLAFSITLVAIIGMYEFFSVTKNNSEMCIVSYVSAISYIALNISFTLVLALLIIVVCCMHITDSSRGSVLDLGVAVLGFVYLGFMLGFVSMVRNLDEGVYLVWLIFISAWGTDTFAYFTGKLFGKRKLCPTLSPSKTVEGAIGGVIGAAILGGLYAFVLSTTLPQAPLTSHNPLIYASLSAVAAVASIFGDLTASAIKRSFGTKDFGKIFPGHGGVLDRFDSVLFTAPIIYITVALF